MVGSPPTTSVEDTALPSLFEDTERSTAVERPETIHLRALMQVPAMVSRVRGPDHVYEFVNKRHVEVLGDRDYIGRPARDVIPEAVEQGLIDILDRVYTSGEAFVANEMPLRFAQGDGGAPEEGFYNFIYQPLRDERGNVSGIMIHAVNVTEEVRARRQLEHLAAERAAILSQMADGVIVVDAAGSITFQNEAARRLLGPDGMGLPLDKYLEQVEILSQDGSSPPAEETWIRQAVLRGEPRLDVERRIRRPDGTVLVLHGSAAPVVADDGSRYGSVFTFRDITERKRLEHERARHQQELTTRALQAQEDERKRIARELHDETVQDLTTLLINLDLAERRLPDGNGEAVALERVRAIATRALEATRALAHSLRPPILDDVGLAAALEALGEEHVQTYGVAVSVQAESEIRLAPYVETVIFRVAQEALTNACKHALGREVRIRFTIADGMGTLTVCDNGRGFDPQHVSSGGRHSGLGLDGMRERAALVGGNLRILSTPGEGTRVELRVWVDGEHPGVPPQPQVDDGHARAEAAATRILLVDDHAMVREGLKVILEAHPGLRIAGEAEDGRQAIELVERIHPDIVVMDIAMPNLNGLDATRQIKHRFPEVKVLILTSHENRQYVTQIVKTGADGCLLKRSAGTELIAALETLIQGQNYISPTVAGSLLDDYRVRIDRGGDDLLTEREREVIQLVAEGHTNRGIARNLGISVKTVETHRANIMEKLGAADRTDLVKYAIRTGMISPE